MRRRRRRWRRGRRRRTWRRMGQRNSLYPYASRSAALSPGLSWCLGGLSWRVILGERGVLGCLGPLPSSLVVLGCARVRGRYLARENASPPGPNKSSTVV
eukprot:7109161-Pyramimonas_sp.AAC.1